MPLMFFGKKTMPQGTSTESATGAQFGTIPYRVVDGHAVFLMITSRRSANWVFPKGSVIPGLTPEQTAAQETFEEAGVRGQIAAEPIGAYRHPGNKDAAELVSVQLFPLLVTEQVDDWPELAQRFRHWALLPQMRSLMASKQAARLAVDLSRQVLQ